MYAVRLNLRQLVSLWRNPSAEAFVIPWQTESVGIRRLSLIGERIKSLVDVFIEAYTSENLLFYQKKMIVLKDTFSSIRKRKHFVHVDLR